jgi:hypothetical protein
LSLNIFIIIHGLALLKIHIDHIPKLFVRREEGKPSVEGVGKGERGGQRGNYRVPAYGSKLAS